MRSYAVAVHATVMLAVAVAVWGVDPIEPVPCAGLMLVFTWCAYRIGAPNDWRWVADLVGVGDAVMDGIRM